MHYPDALQTVEKAIIYRVYIDYVNHCEKENQEVYHIPHTEKKRLLSIYAAIDKACR
jgi:hypothetical protein